MNACCGITAVQLAESKQASSAQTAVIIRQEGIIERLHTEIAEKQAELLRTKALLASKAHVTCVSRACSPADVETYQAEGPCELTKPIQPDSTRSKVSDARRMLEQLGKKLTAATLENAVVNQCKCVCIVLVLVVLNGSTRRSSLLQPM